MATVILLGNPGYIELMVVCGLLGFAGGGTLPLLGSIVGSRFGPQSFGQVMGLLMPPLTLSSFGVVVTGMLRDMTGNYDLALMVGLGLMVPAVLGMLAMPKRRS